MLEDADSSKLLKKSLIANVVHAYCMEANLIKMMFSLNGSYPLVPLAALYRRTASLLAHSDRIINQLRGESKS